MNGFTAFATMSLTDLISRPLALIQSHLKSTEASAGSLSARLGKMAGGFGKAAIAAGLFLGALGMTTGAAMAFESKMADVAKVVAFESPAELGEMQRTLEDLSLLIPITAEGFADITAAAAQSGVAKDDLKDFSVAAAKMGVAFDVAAGDASTTMANWRASMGLTLTETYSLADAVNHLANNMNATAPDISEVLNRMGAVGKAAGFAETELAALAASGLSSGSAAEVVGTAFNSIFSTLTQGTAMVDRAAQAFKSLGYDAESLAKSMQMDAKGTMLSVLESIADLPKEAQLSIITSAFGQEALKTIAPLVGNLDALRGAFGLVGDAAAYAGSMEKEYAARSATTENSVQLMKNSFNVLAITVGKIFLPVLDSAAKAVSFLTGLLIEFGCSEAGAFIIKLAAGIAAAVTVVGGLVVALAVLKPIIILVGGALAGVLWPITLIAGAVALLSLAWKKDFLGIRAAVTNFAGKVKLVFQGVLAVFKTLKDGHGKLSGELGKEIKAAGLVGLVTTVSRIVYRVTEFFKAMGEGVMAEVAPAFARLGDAFGAVADIVKPIVDEIFGLSNSLGEAAGATDVSAWRAWGNVIGGMVGYTLGWFVDVLGVAVMCIGAMIEVVKIAASPFIALAKGIMYVISNAGQLASSAKQAILSFADSVVNTVSGVMTAISNFSLVDAGMGLINGFADGVKAGAASLVAAVEGVLARVREFLPFSDAKVGPLSNLTASGMAFIETIKTGIMAKAGELVDSVKGVLGRVRGFLFGENEAAPMASVAAGTMLPRPMVTDSLADYSGFNMPQTVPYNYMPLPAAPTFSMPAPRFDFVGDAPEPPAFGSRARTAAYGAKTMNFHIGNITLPNAKDRDGFIAALENIAEQRA